MFLLLLSAALACNSATPFIEKPQPRMGVRFTQRGLEKFYQMGYAIIPDIIDLMPPFQINGISLGPLKLDLSNIKPRAVRVETMRVYLQANNSVKMEARNGLMQLSMRLTATISGITGTVDCLFTLRDFGGDISLKIGDDLTCPYHFGMFDIKSLVSFSKLGIDATGLDTGGSIITNTLQGMTPVLETLMKKIVLHSIMNTIFISLKQSMLDLPMVVWEGDYGTDQRYINGINIIDKKIVANQGGYSITLNGKGSSSSTFYPNKITSPLPKTVYTNQDYEFYIDREAINSYLYVWHKGHDRFKADELTIPYNSNDAQSIPNLIEALVRAKILASTNDPGDGVTIVLSIKPSNSIAPNVPWIGASLLPIHFTGTMTVTAKARDPSVFTTLTSVDGNMLFSSAFKLKNYTYGFANDQARAYLELVDLIDITITKQVGGDMNDPNFLLNYLIPKLYIPALNEIISDPGICLMNGNFIDIDTITAIHLCDEDKILFVADIKKNPYFP